MSALNANTTHKGGAAICTCRDPQSRLVVVVAIGACPGLLRWLLLFVLLLLLCVGVVVVVVGGVATGGWAWLDANGRLGVRVAAATAATAASATAVIRDGGGAHLGDTRGATCTSTCASGPWRHILYRRRCGAPRGILRALDVYAQALCVSLAVGAWPLPNGARRSAGCRSCCRRLS